MSGKYWWPRPMPSSVTGVLKCTPSAALATKILACPPGSSADQTTWTPVESAAIADRLEQRENVRPVGHANAPSPQSTEPLPLNWLDSKARNRASSAGSLNDTPPSVDR